MNFSSAFFVDGTVTLTFKQGAPRLRQPKVQVRIAAFADGFRHSAVLRRQQQMPLPQRPGSDLQQTLPLPQEDGRFIRRLQAHAAVGGKAVLFSFKDQRADAAREAGLNF